MVNKNNIAKKDFSNDLHKEIKKYITEKVVKLLNEDTGRNRKELLKIIGEYEFKDNILRTIHEKILIVLGKNDKKEWDNNDVGFGVSKKIIIELLYRFGQEEFINYLLNETKFEIKEYDTSKKEIVTISSQLYSYFKSKRIEFNKFKEFYDKNHLKNYIRKSIKMDLSDNIKIGIDKCSDKNVDKIIVGTFPGRKTLKSNSENTAIYYCDPSNSFWKDYMFHCVDGEENVKNIIASISYIDYLYKKLEDVQDSIQTLTLDLLGVDNINKSGKRGKTFWRWQTYIKEYEIQLDFYENKILKEKELLGEMEKEFCETHEINFGDRVKVCFCDSHSSLDSSRIAIVYNDLSKYNNIFCNGGINDTSIGSVDYIRGLNSELLGKLKKEKVLTLNLNGTATTITILNSSSKTGENSRDIENWKTMLKLK